MDELKVIRWCAVAKAADVPEEDVIRAEFEDYEFAIYNIAGEIHASDDCCTHQEARLSDGFVIDDVIECPLHQGRFHIPTGDALGPPVSKCLKTYPVRVVDGQVLVGVEAIAGTD